jgi:flagellar assembly factor FliW
MPLALGDRARVFRPMPTCATKYSGMVQYEDSAVLQFPAGLPGFECETRFLPLHRPGYEPLIFLQSVETPDLCFVTTPVQTIDPSYQLEVAEQDLELLGLSVSGQPEIGRDVLCVAILTVKENSVTANLRAPIVVSLRNSRAVQSLVQTLAYSHEQSVVRGKEAECS